MKNIPIIDLHQDLLLHIKDKSKCVNKSQTSWEALQMSQIKVTIATAFVVPPNEDWTHAISNTLIEQEFSEYADKINKLQEFSLVKNNADLVRVFANSNACGIILHIEGLNCFEDTPEYWDMLERWYELGWRSLGISWNIANSLAGGTNEPNIGLTQLGKKVIQWACRKGMLIDFAHMNRKTFWDVATIITQPIYISHGGVDALTPSLRNYTDKQLHAVAKSNGIIGLFFSRTFLQLQDDNEDTKINSIIAHIDYIRQLIGIDHVALGSDLGGFLGPTIQGAGSVFEIENILETLRSRGYSIEDIEKICYKNAMRYLNCVMR